MQMHWSFSWQPNDFKFTQSGEAPVHFCETAGIAMLSRSQMDLLISYGVPEVRLSVLNSSFLMYFCRLFWLSIQADWKG